MKKPFVFIISQFYEPNVDAISAKLEKLDVPYFRLNTETIPLITNTNLYVGENELYAVFSLNGTRMDTRDVTSVWRRRIGEFVFPDGTTQNERGFIRHECASMLHGAFESMNCLWVNPFVSDYRANVKAYQFEVARKIGLSIPRTLITNDPEAVEEFAESMACPVLFKPVIGLTTGGPPDFSAEVEAAYEGQFHLTPATPEPRNPEAKAIFSQILTQEKRNGLKNLSGCPAIFQEYIEKRVEIRITIIGEDIFAAEIHSQEREDTKTDFRTQLLSSQHDISGFLHHAKHKLPDDICEKLLALMRELKIVFGCVDMILTPEGDYVFLEVNTAGQWQWVEHLTGMPITDSLVNLLVRGTVN